MTEDELANLLLKAGRDEFLALIRRQLSPKLEQRIGAEDILHDAFLRALQKRKWLNTSATLEQLEQRLKRIAFEETIDQIRRALGRTRNADREIHFPDESVVQVEMRLYGSQTSASKALARQQRIALVRDALMKLDLLDREILLLRFDSELSYKVIGHVLDPQMAENAVNRRCLRAIKKLGELLPSAESLY
jgi:RNA polymerase sigma factor (sigma-70 family)